MLFLQALEKLTELNPIPAIPEGTGVLADRQLPLLSQSGKMDILDVDHRAHNPEKPFEDLLGRTHATQASSPERADQERLQEVQSMVPECDLRSPDLLTQFTELLTTTT